ncbi:glycosyltransferase family 4 protein [Pseudoalteromonas tunicata]|uniref:glycosyltransferase family 4 protein n=1 Tax=Pseudoalteromonas tunicata TaxID=314281 RepID=UPI00273E47FA|nr:glycosyltransferase family 4 protein [Pseudoalteromonas tunicata]MDP4985536.1 glycosyltransferase family 4 protein [Pseudoalteromonas tunicata]MDP5212911.1 glycosyltransferase family 4 protein [Pseudoalteromonas tunicata]
MHAKIILLVDSSLFGGIESHLVQLAQLLKTNDTAVEIVFYQQHNNVQFYDLLDKNLLNYRILSGRFTGLYRFLKQQKNIILHTHGYKAGILGRLVALWLNLPVVSTFHAGEVGNGRVKYYNLLDRLLSCLSINFAVSEQIAKKINQAQVLHNFITPKNLVIKPLGTPIKIGFVGRLSYEKGPDIFSKLAHSCQENTQFEFHLYGDGPMKQTLKPTSNLVIHGQQNAADIWPFLDVLVVSSREEGMPMIILEAMNHGVAIVSHRVGAIGSILTDNLNAQLTDEFGENALKQALLRWETCSSDDKIEQLHVANQLLNQEYSGKKQYRQLHQVYQQLSYNG